MSGEPPVPAFARRFFDPERRITRIGAGALGGKARGLLAAARILEERRAELQVPGLQLDVKMTSAYLAVSELARKQKLYMRDAAYVIAISRVAQACRDRGWV